MAREDWNGAISGSTLGSMAKRVFDREENRSMGGLRSEEEHAANTCLKSVTVSCNSKLDLWIVNLTSAIAIYSAIPHHSQERPQST